MSRSLFLGLTSVFICATVVGCSLSPTETVVSATANPLVALYQFAPGRSAQVTVEFGTDTTYGFTTSSQPTVSGTVGVSILVAGMKANTLYHMRAIAQFIDGTSLTDTDHTFRTGKVPSGLLPTYNVTPTSGMTPQPGVELVDVLQGATPSIPFATDLAGNVIWYYSFPDHQPASIIYPIKLLNNGHFLCMIGPQSQSVETAPAPPGTLSVIREIDLAGTIIRQLTMADLNTRLAAAGFNITLQLFSHDIVELPNGHLLAITNTIKPFVNLPGYPGTTNVVGDVVVDLDENLQPVWVWNEFDHFDVNRHPMSFPDWTHSNSIVYSPDDGNFVVSIRHQNWIVKVDYKNGLGAGDVVWKLGEGGDFTLQGATDPTDWFYAQHDASFQSPNSTGNFLMSVMDNGDDRMFPPGVTCNSAGAPPCLYTTVQVLRVDENAKTVSFVFHQVQPTSLYSAFAGDTLPLGNNNIEYNLAGVGTDAYVFEVTPTSTPATVWQMHIVGSNTYRAYRMGSLYPGVQW